MYPYSGPARSSWIFYKVGYLVNRNGNEVDHRSRYGSCTLYSTKGGRLKDRISFYTVGLTMMIFDVEVVLTFAFLLSLTFATTGSRAGNSIW